MRKAQTLIERALRLFPEAADEIRAVRDPSNLPRIRIGGDVEVIQFDRRVFYVFVGPHLSSAHATTEMDNALVVAMSHSHEWYRPAVDALHMRALVEAEYGNAVEAETSFERAAARRLVAEGVLHEVEPDWYELAPQD